MAEQNGTTAGFTGKKDEKKTGPATEKPGFAQPENGNENQSDINPAGFYFCGKVSMAHEIWPG
ncbi:MAG: hypothetical protein PHR36_02150 [Patescibacteria group bacterium]|nr:hypothetical protein [Patescibacteria group bacterium]